MIMETKRGLETEQLKIGYDSDLVSGICIAVKPGQIVSLIGPNGSGKSTLLKTVTRELKRRGGCVFLDGKDMAQMRDADAARLLSMVMTYKIRPELMTCREVVEVGRYPYTGRTGILSETDREIVREALMWTDTLDLADTYFQNISDGQRQRVMLSRAICQQGEILVLDEPVSFLDLRHKLDILEKIRLLAKEKNIAVLMSLHELEIAMRISDYTAAVGEGRILRMGTPREVFREDFIRKLYHIEEKDTGLLGTTPWFEAGADADVLTSPAIKKASGGGAKVIMIQGTMSNAGKSLIAAGLCRIFAEDGFRTAPFKSQNMALNSYVTKDGLEMGRAQAVQAECAMTEPEVIMNPILLKPLSEKGSQVIVGGKVKGNMSAPEYFARRKDFRKDILSAYEQLSAKADVIVVEGAGSPAELNLKKDDIVNMGLAAMIDAPVLLVGDIDRGGVFAQLIGTLDLLEKEERERVKGIVVNKFRGDKKLFEDGIRILEEKGKTKVVGVVPYMEVKIDDEDSLSGRLAAAGHPAGKKIRIDVIRLPHISNFTDLNPFDQLESASVRYLSSPREIQDPDLIVIPGSKNTIHDLRWLKEEGLTERIKEKALSGIPVLGICGGYQMLGKSVLDAEGVECGGTEEGIGLLNVETALGTQKKRVQFQGCIEDASGILSGLKGKAVQGYEIHMGETVPCGEVRAFTSGGSGYCAGNVYGTYVHGFFDRKEILTSTAAALLGKGNETADLLHLEDYAEFKEEQYNRLARILRQNLDMDYIYDIMGLVRK